jgi:hypothetical protein
MGDHPSMRPTWECRRAGSPLPVRPCSGWGLPSRPGRPGRWCALTAPFHPHLCPFPGGNRPSAVCSLWHFPAGRPDWPLASILPCGAPTFLSVETTPRSPGRLTVPTSLAADFRLRHPSVGTNNAPTWKHSSIHRYRSQFLRGFRRTALCWMAGTWAAPVVDWNPRSSTRIPQWRPRRHALSTSAPDVRCAASAWTMQWLVVNRPASGEEPPSAIAAGSSAVAGTPDRHCRHHGSGRLRRLARPAGTTL